MAVLLVGLLLPGYCVLTLLGLLPMSPALAIPAAFGMGIAVYSVAAWLGWASGTGLTGAAFVAGAMIVGAGLARIIRRSRVVPIERPSNFDWAAAALAAVGIGCVLVSGPWMGQSADPFYHMAAAQAMLRENRAMPQDVFFGVTMPYPDVTSGTLHLVLAWLSLVTGMVPVWVALTFFGAAFTAVCFAAFARELTGSAVAGFISGAFYLVLGLSLDMRSGGYPNRIAPGLVWLSFVFFLRFARRRSGPGQWRELVPASLLAFGAASVHPSMAPLIVVMVASTFLAAAVVTVVRRRPPRSLAPLAIACTALMLFVVPLLIVRVLAAVPLPGPEASLATWAPPLNTHTIGVYSFVDPRFWFAGWITVMSIGTLCLLGGARRLLLDGDPGGALLWGGALFSPLFGMTPLLTQVPNELYFFARVAGMLIPLLFVTIAWELSRLPGLAPTGVLEPRANTISQFVAGYLLACVTFWIVGDQVSTSVLPVYQGHLANSVSTSRANDLTVLWAVRLRVLKSAGPGAILAGLESSYELAGLTGRRVVAVPFGHSSYQDEARDGALRRGDVADALNPSSDPTSLLSTLYRYNVTFVMVDRARDGQATWDWIGGQSVLKMAGEGSGWRLYRFDPTSVDRALAITLTNGVGVFPSRVIAGRAVFIRVTSQGQGQTAQVTARGIASDAVYTTQLALPSQAGTTVTTPLLLPDSARVDRYSLSVSVPGSSPVWAGEVQVGHAYEAEFFAGVYFGLNHGFARRAGWEFLENPGYNRGGAASALRTGTVATHPLTEPPGAYCLALDLFDNGSGHARSLDVKVGQTTVVESWTVASAGPRIIEVAVQVGSDRQLAYWVPAHAAVGTVIDRITLFPPPVSGAACAPTASN